MRIIQLHTIADENSSYEIVKGFDDLTPNPGLTEEKVSLLIKEQPEILKTKTYEEIFLENIEYLTPGPSKKVVTEDAYRSLLDKFNRLGPHQHLAFEGDIVTDWRGQEFWVQNTGNWMKGKIDHLNTAPPEDAVFPENLSEDQRKEIAQQTEKDRILSLTQDQRQTEIDSLLADAKRQARILKEEAEIADEDFNAKTFYQEKKSEIEARYDV